MDPLSIIAGVVGVAAAAASSSRQLSELVESIQQAPEEIRSISRDTHAFYSIVYSLEISLNDPKIMATVADDEALTILVGKLKEPLIICTTVLGQMMVKIQAFVRPLDRARHRMSSNDIKWYFLKKEIRQLKERIETSKATLDIGLTAVGTLCSFRIMTAGANDSPKPIRRGSNDTDAGFALRRYVKEKEIASSYTEPSVPPSPLMGASMPQNTPMPQLESGSDENESPQPEVGNLTEQLFNAVEQGNAPLVQRLIRNGAEVNIREWDGEAAIHHAVRWKRLEIAQLLINNNADVNIRCLTRDTRNGETPLHYAVLCGYEDIIRLLIDNGADVGATDSGQTPLHVAAHIGDARAIDILLSHHADIDARTSQGATPIIIAVSSGNTSAVKVLLDRGANVSLPQNINGMTPLEVACHKGHLHVVKLILDAGAAADGDKSHAWTPLEVAAAKGHREILELLVKYGATFDIEDQRWNKVIETAIYSRDVRSKEAKEYIEWLCNQRNEQKMLGTKNKGMNIEEEPDFLDMEEVD